MTSDQGLELTIKGDVSRLHLEPGDTILIKLRGEPTNDTVERISRVLKGKFPGHEILIVSPEVTIEVAGA